MLCLLGPIYGTDCFIDIRDSLRGGIISRGLRVFYKILEADDHEELADLMQEYLVLSPEFIDVALSESTMYFRRERYALEGDRMEARSERLPFSGDTEDSPPLAWVTQWRGIYSNRYGEDLPNGLKQWGHVFWDRRRLIKSKGMEAVLRERQADSIYLY